MNRPSVIPLSVCQIMETELGSVFSSEWTERGLTDSGPALNTVGQFVSHQSRVADSLLLLRLFFILLFFFFCCFYSHSQCEFRRVFGEETPGNTEELMAIRHSTTPYGRRNNLFFGFFFFPHTQHSTSLPRSYPRLRFSETSQIS